MLVIPRGSTRTVYARLPKGIDPADIKTIWFSIGQMGRVVIDKQTEDFTVDGQILSVTLTQIETLALVDGVGTDAQMRLLMNDGTAIPSTTKPALVLGLVKDGVIA